MLIIIGLIGFIAFYVINTNHNAQKQLDAATKTTDVPASIKINNGGFVSKVIAFKDGGIKITLPELLQGMTYSKNTSSADESYDVTTPQFKQLAAQCGDSAPTGFATIYAKAGQFPGQGNEGTNGLLKQFDDRYIAYGDPLYGDAGCDQKVYDQLATLQTSLIELLKSAFQDATEVK